MANPIIPAVPIEKKLNDSPVVEMLRFPCPNPYCSVTNHKAPWTAINKKTHCPKCGTDFFIPSKNGAMPVLCAPLAMAAEIVEVKPPKVEVIPAQPAKVEATPLSIHHSKDGTSVKASIPVEAWKYLAVGVCILLGILAILVCPILLPLVVPAIPAGMTFLKKR